MADTAAPLTPMATLRFDLINRVLADISPDTILELGCGQGAAGARLTDRARYVGVEPDPQSCAVAQRRLAGRGEVLAGDHTSVPAGSVYDLVCAFEVLEHIEHDEKVLAEWVELVRPGGHLLLSVPAWPGRFGPMDTAVGHFRRYSPADLTGVLERAGLTEVRVMLYGWPLGYMLEFTRERVARRRSHTTEEQSVAERTAGSGRLFQPSAMIGRAVRAGTLPFVYLQRLVPDHGTGIVAVASRPV